MDGWMADMPIHMSECQLMCGSDGLYDALGNFNWSPPPLPAGGPAMALHALHA